MRAALGAISFLGIILFWATIRYKPTIAFDPSVPLVLVIGGLSGLLMLSARGWLEVARQVFSGIPLMLAAVLVAVGVLVQIMALTGVRGWIVINAMSFKSPSIYIALAGFSPSRLRAHVDRRIELAWRAVRLCIHPSGHDPEYQRALSTGRPIRVLPAHGNLGGARRLCGWDGPTMADHPRSAANAGLSHDARDFDADLQSGACAIPAMTRESLRDSGHA